MRIVAPLPSSFLRSREMNASSALSPSASSKLESFSEKLRLLTIAARRRHQLGQHRELARRQFEGSPRVVQRR